MFLRFSTHIADAVSLTPLPTYGARSTTEFVRYTHTVCMKRNGDFFSISGQIDLRLWMELRSRKANNILDNLTCDDCYNHRNVELDEGN